MNLFRVIRSDSACLIFYAKRDIREGEELLIDYADPLVGREERNELLKPYDIQE